MPRRDTMTWGGHRSDGPPAQQNARRLSGRGHQPGAGDAVGRQPGLLPDRGLLPGQFPGAVAVHLCLVRHGGRVGRPNLDRGGTRAGGPFAVPLAIAVFMAVNKFVQFQGNLRAAEHGDHLWADRTGVVVGRQTHLGLHADRRGGGGRGRRAAGGRRHGSARQDGAATEHYAQRRRCRRQRGARGQVHH